MKLACFPEPVRGELLYGLLARHRRMIGFIPAAVHSAELFGRSAAIAAFDLPSGLSQLAERLPMRLGIGMSELLGHTLFPYYAAQQPSHVRTAASAEMLSGPSSAAHNRLGVNAFTIRPFEALRFCPECVRDQMLEIGEATWLVLAQAPGVTICTRHGCMIMESALTRSAAGRHGYLGPDAVLQSTAPIAAPRGLAGDRLATLTKDLSTLWEDVTEAVPLALRRDFYRARLADVGLMRSRETVDLRALIDAFRAYWAPAFEHLPAGCIVPDNGGWLASLTRTHRKAFHPLMHAMLGRFLLDAPVALASPDPFGTGPWECRNVLADHHGRPRAMQVKVHRERYGLVGRFKCDCGYEFTRAARHDGSLGVPRLRRAGPLLETALRMLVIPGAGLRTVARQVNLDPKTLVREALALGIEVPWSTKPSGYPARKALLTKSVRVHRRQGGIPRHDWVARDCDLTARLHIAVREVMEMVPPVRAARSELERRVARPGFFAKRRLKLPQSIALLDQLAEDVDTFQRRRVRYWAEQMGGEVRPWWIMRRAGLKGDRLQMVKEEIRAVK